MAELSFSALRAAEQFFHEKIPLTNAMAIRIVPDRDHGFAVEAPVSFNYNHLGTAFGGSINSVATLAGYSFLWLKLRDQAPRIVVGKSSIRYFKPIREVIRATCSQPENIAWENFATSFSERGRASLQLHVAVREAGEIAAEFEGTFVAENKAR
jgi:thioesterase domain-containing protein